MKSAPSSPRRSNPVYALLSVALVAAIAFMGWSLWSRSQQAVEVGVVALNGARPDLPRPQMPSPAPR